MKGAKTQPVSSRLAQLHMATNHLDDVDSGEQFLDEGLGNHGRTLTLESVIQRRPG